MATARVVVLRSTKGDQRHLGVVARWVRWLFPAAALFVGSVPEGSADPVIVDADDVASGPLAVADRVGKAMARRA